MKSQDPPKLNKNITMHAAQVKDSGILDYRSEALPTWCPGCGYYGITHGILKALNHLKVEPRNFTVVSGIGCAGRYPFFMKGYGLHSIHGRAIPIACGVKMANPDLTVMVVGGDGDGLGIGGGHLPHAIRRNVDITYILFDNAIYGLTKGQSSPTTPYGQVTKTTPYGTPEKPLNPLVLGTAYGASFLGSGYAGKPQELQTLFEEAFEHKGFSFCVITTPCITFDHQNITYENFRDVWQPVPANHDISDKAAAMSLAMDDNHYTGVLFKETRPTWSESQEKIRDNAK